MEDVLVLSFIHPHHVGIVHGVTPCGREEGLEELQGRDDTELGDDDEELVDGAGVAVGEAGAGGGLICVCGFV